MRHIDDDPLALIALGELHPDADQAQHLLECGRCRDEVDGLRAVVTAARSGGPLEAPPEHVWERVLAEISPPPSTGERPEAGASRERRRPNSRPAGRRETPRRRSRLVHVTWLAAGLVAGVAGTLVIGQLQETEVPETTVATADLDPLPGWEEAGQARVQEVDGRLLLHVEVTGEVPDGYREVWLLDEEVSQLVSVGMLVGEEGTFDLPDGLDLAELAVVDVSHEPFDGDPNHSGESIVRGQLEG
ncbi:anti-sigma factor [Bogoriella caseilytica]|uniref:Anti-sigma-K factor rskA n=1 Tax=Bogoriella caseilytica TaxID=56055 RepID=A0A3N2BFH3_9MICO|nr:anti-sigma factor [Bogoriella caseilytica]ROR73997.1 anti-sigma-K factor rskA [Bogoriella caseilytica]